MARLKETYRTNIVPKLQEELGLKNVMEVPKITKITLNMGLGEAVGDKKVIENNVIRKAVPPGMHIYKHTDFEGFGRCLGSKHKT